MFAAVVALALGYAASAAAQRTEAVADDPATETASADTDQPRRGRDRRRDAAAAERLPVFEAPTSAQPTDAAAGEVEARMVCKNIKLTGTKIARRICGTQEQWASMEKRNSEKTEEGMRQMRERSSIVTAQPQNPLGGANAGLGGAN
jgi:hypothetical protein